MEQSCVRSKYAYGPAQGLPEPRSVRSARRCTTNDNFEFIHTPGAFGYFMFDKKHDWSYWATPDPRVFGGKPIFVPRGKTLGGSSSINGMVYTRGDRSDYDRWAELGNPGWGYGDVLPYFRKAENNARGADKYHGDEGPLAVSDSELNYTISKVFIEAAEQAGMPMSNDFNGEQYEGFGPFQFTIANGRRCSTAVAYLHPAMNRHDLTVMTSADVVRIEFEGKRAVGVDAVHRGRHVSVKANREVIVSAGAINSPQLLMLSGVGAPDEPKAHGIALVHALPGVGKNLQEHPDAALLTTSHFHGGVQLSLVGAMQMLGEGIEYYGAHMGKLRSSFTEAGGLQSGPQPYRTDVRQAQDAAAKGCGTIRRGEFSPHEIADRCPRAEALAAAMLGGRDQQLERSKNVVSSSGIITAQCVC
jgi:choline dehydrogenase